MLVGTIVKLKRECLDNPPGTRGICYEAYDRGRGEKAASILFENGRSDRFSPEELKETVIPIGIREELMNYRFENSKKVMEDFRAGLFNTALRILTE